MLDYTRNKHFSLTRIECGATLMWNEIRAHVEEIVGPQLKRTLTAYQEVYRLRGFGLTERLAKPLSRLKTIPVLIIASVGALSFAATVTAVGFGLFLGDNFSPSVAIQTLLLTGALFLLICTFLVIALRSTISSIGKDLHDIAHSLNQSPTNNTNHPFH